MDTAQWPQEIVVKPMEDTTIVLPNTCSSSLEVTNNNNNKGSSTSLERKVRPQKDQAVNCPRCNSTNTKFCYYNNYSLTQPRYFCKTCRRYWTEGGSLRNIPVGGGSRKNKRSSSYNSSNYSSNQNHNNHNNDDNRNENNNNNNPSDSPPFSTPSKKLALDPHNLTVTTHFTQNPKDLNLGFSQNTRQEFRTLSEFIHLPTIETTPIAKTQIPNSSSPNHHQLSALELLNGLTSSRGLTPFMPMPMSMPDPNGVYSSSSGFAALHDFKPNTLNFTLDHGFGGNGYGGSDLQGQQQEGNNNNINNGRLLFPFEDLKQVSSNNNTTSAHDNNQNDSATNDNDHDHQQQAREQGDSNGYWSGMLGMGGSW